MPCPFCPRVERKTEWHLHDVVNHIVACEDLHPKGYKYRILVVGSGLRWHRSWKEHSEAEKEFLAGIVANIGYNHLNTGEAKELVKIDTEHFSHSEHGHCQVCMI